MLIALAGAVVAATFLLSALLTPVTRAVARRMGMMDAPTERKDHTAPTPLLGGSAIMASILIVSLIGLAMGALWADHPPTWLPQELAAHLPGVVARTPMAMGILAGALALHVLGLIDDRRNLGAVAKLAVQIAVAAGVVVFAEVRVLTMAGPALSIAATILWLVGIINAFNFLDNADGLSVGVASICAAALLAATVQMEQMFVTAWLCVLLGAMLGYLPYNYPPASTFMGDSGSLVIGY
ncbi:MAG: glycosyltransferase family 4 protein, partial [Planctomycetota bacterium]